MISRVKLQTFVHWAYNFIKTKNKHELTLPSEFCRFPVKIMAAYEVLKKKKNTGPSGQWK